MKADDFKAAKLYTNDDSTLWWNSVKKKPDVKKQPKINPKAAGKNKVHCCPVARESVFVCLRFVCVSVDELRIRRRQK